MKKKELENLKVGDLVISKRDESIGRVIRVQEDNFLIDNSVTVRKASVSTMIRWYNLYVEEEIPEVVEPNNTVINDIEQAEDLTQEQQDTQEQDNTATITQEQLDNITPGNWIIRKKDNSRHQITARVTETKKFGIDGHKVITFQDVQDNYILEDNTTAKTGTATTNTLNSIVEQYNCKLERKRQYIKVSREGLNKTLVYIRTPKGKGTGYHFDIAKRTWCKLTSEYQTYLIEQYGASIVDSTRGLWRVSCKELDVFEVLLLTALQIA